MFFNAFSIQKIKEAKFFNEQTGFVVEVLDTKNLKRQNFLTRTDMSFKTAQKGKEKHQKLTDF